MTTDRTSVFLVLLPSLLLLPMAIGPAVAQEAPDGWTILEGLQSWLDGTEDLKGDFRQTLVSGALGSGLEEQGKLFVQRPGRMRWEYREPEKKLALVVGEKTWLYLEEDEQLFRGHLDPDGRILPLLLAGDGRLKELFRPEITATPDRGGDGSYHLRLVPLSGSESFHQVVLAVRPPGFSIESAEVLDPAGNRMRYDFKGLRRNKGISEALFHFSPPPGTLISGEH